MKEGGGNPNILPNNEDIFNVSSSQNNEEVEVAVSEKNQLNNSKSS